jgi:hypothetical protein
MNLFGCHPVYGSWGWLADNQRQIFHYNRTWGEIKNKPAKNLGMAIANFLDLKPRKSTSDQLDKNENFSPPTLGESWNSPYSIKLRNTTFSRA